MSDKTKDSLLVISGNIRLKVHDLFLMARLRWHRTVRTARYGSWGGPRSGPTKLLNKSARSEQLLFVGT